MTVPYRLKGTPKTRVYRLHTPLWAAQEISLLPGEVRELRPTSLTLSPSAAAALHETACFEPGSSVRTASESPVVDAVRPNPTGHRGRTTPGAGGWDLSGREPDSR